MTARLPELEFILKKKTVVFDASYVKESSFRINSPTSAWWNTTMDMGSTRRHSWVDLAATPKPWEQDSDDRSRVISRTPVTPRDHRPWGNLQGAHPPWSRPQLLGTAWCSPWFCRAQISARGSRKGRTALLQVSPTPWTAENISHQSLWLPTCHTDRNLIRRLVSIKGWTPLKWKLDSFYLY